MIEQQLLQFSKMLDEGAQVTVAQFEIIGDIAKLALSSKEKDGLLAILTDCADRQWSTYELLDNSLRSELGAAVLSLWDKKSLDSTEKMLSVIAKLGLADAFDHVSSLDKSSLPPDVSNEISSAISEFGKTVNDPYSGMR